MTKTILGYAAILAVGVLALEWLEYRYIARAFPVTLYLGLVAAGFAAIGVWAGMKLAPGARGTLCTQSGRDHIPQPDAA